MILFSSLSPKISQCFYQNRYSINFSSTELLSSAYHWEEISSHYFIMSSYESSQELVIFLRRLGRHKSNKKDFTYCPAEEIHRDCLNVWMLKIISHSMVSWNDTAKKCQCIEVESQLHLTLMYFKPKLLPLNLGPCLFLEAILSSRSNTDFSMAQILSHVLSASLCNSLNRWNVFLFSKLSYLICIMV